MPGCLLLLALFVTTTGKAQNLAANSESQMELLPDVYEIPFTWQGDSVHGSWEPHAAILVPVTLPNCSKTFFMQFDLGSNISMFYGPALQSIRKKYPDAINGETGNLLNVSFSLDKMPVHAKQISVKQYGEGTINWINDKTPVIIGTIGMDLFDNRFLAINYAGKKMLTGDAIPADLLKGMDLSPLIYAGGKLLLPASLRGKKQLLYFDTGSSAFALMTDRATSEQLSVPDSKPLAFSMNSWGKLLSVFSLPTNDSILIASQKLPLHQTSYVEGVNGSVVEQMLKMGITGLTGNKLFLHSMLLIDLKNRRFGIRGM